MPETYGFCLNSRRWVFRIDIDGLPQSCPNKGFQGDTYCKGESCGYYEERELTPHAKRMLADLQEETDWAAQERDEALGDDLGGHPGYDTTFGTK